MTALDAFLWTVTVVMWIIIAVVGWAAVCATRDAIEHRRRSLKATLHAVNDASPVVYLEADEDLRKRVLERARGSDLRTIDAIRVAHGHHLDALAVRWRMGRRVGPKESA